MYVVVTVRTHVVYVVDAHKIYLVGAFIILYVYIIYIMSGPPKILRSYYYDKERKRNVYKQVSISRFDGDEMKAKEYLDNWRQSCLDRQAEKQAQKIADEEKEVETTQENIVTNNNPEIYQEPFKLNLAKDTGSTICIYGSSKSGKTWQMKEILKKFLDKPDTICILVAENIHSKTYKDIPKRVLKMSYFDEILIKQLHRLNKKTKNRYKFCLIMDDMILHKNSSMMMSMICTFRNANISSCFLFQACQMMSKINRGNLNHIIFRKQNNNEQIEICIRDYLGGYHPFYGKSMDHKIKLYRDATSNYNFIYLNALDDKLYFCK